MADLNLALKKEVFEGITNGTTNEIPIKKNDWWKKRLMDLDTGRFKWFDNVIVTSGSSDKFTYKLDHIELRDEEYIIIIDRGMNVPDSGESELEEEEPIADKVIEPEVIKPEKIEPEKIEPEKVVEVNPEPVKTSPLTEEQKQAIIKKYVEKVKEKEKEVEKEPTDVRVAVMKLLDQFCKNPAVYVVNMPYVTIRNSGMIVGCNRRLFVDKDSDVRIDFKKVEFTQYLDMSDEMYLGEIAGYMEQLLKNNYVFINKKYCGFTTSDFGEHIFKMAVTPKKKYLFNRK